jgi:hypothetical protein
MGIPKRKASSKELASLPNNNNSTTNYNDVTNLDDFLFNPNVIVEDEETLISIQGKRVLSEANIMCIAGKPKSRKSVVAHSILASAIAKKPVLGIECSIDGDIVLIDTEQSNSDISKSLQRLKLMADINKFESNLKVYTFRSLNADKIKVAIPKILTENTRIKLLIIDGGLDLINNMNDVVEVKDTIDWFKNLLVKFKVGIVTIVHQSKASNFTIGHLGSFLDRFSQSVIEITKLDNGNSNIKSQFMRSDSDFNSYEFYYNYNTNQYAVNWTEPSHLTKSNPADYTIDQHMLNLKKMYTGRTFFLHKDLVKEIVKTYQKSETWAKYCIEHFYEQVLIFKEKNGIYFNEETPF